MILSDRQAADAVRGHIDWKYLLSLPLTDPGFDYSILSEFRTRLLAGGAEQKLLDILLTRLREAELLKTHKIPLAQTRSSRFKQLQPQSA